MELIKLTARKVKVETGLYKGFTKTQFFKPDGKLFCTMPAYSRQPRKDSKIIVINCFKYALTWN